MALKAAQVVPDTGLDLEAVEGTGTDASPADDPGSRLAEYRLFRAAVDGFLADATGEASRTFLATVGPPAAAVPTDSTLTISQERLVGALRGVLARLPETPPATITAAPAVSVEERCAALRTLFAERGAVPFVELFATATSRLEAVATFLALLELLKRGEVLVEDRPSGEIMLAVGRSVDGESRTPA
jgi:segregation and condensation protein A